MYTLLAALLLTPDIDRLGSHSPYAAREWAELRLRTLGVLAWPALLDALGSPDPEVRDRAARLLRPRGNLLADLRAADVLAGPWPPSSVEFYCDWAWRERVYRLAVRGGCPGWMTDPIRPGHYDNWPGWFAAVMPHAKCWAAVMRCRRCLGFADDGWLFRVGAEWHEGWGRRGRGRDGDGFRTRRHGRPAA